MRLLLTVLLVALATSEARRTKPNDRPERPEGRHHGDGPHHGDGSRLPPILADIPEENRLQGEECARALKPTDRTVNRANKDACLTELSIDTSSLDGMSHTERKEFFKNLMESEQGDDMRKCLAEKAGFTLADGSGIDMNAVRTEIRERVSTASETVKANVEIGIAGCPDIVNYDVKTYKDCVLLTCATGAVPTAS